MAQGTAYGSAGAQVLHRAQDPGDDQLECSWGLGVSGQVLWEDEGGKGSRMMEWRLEINNKPWELGWS